MPRPPIERAVSGVPRITLFKPAGVPARELEQLQLGVDELEAIRLVDLEGLSHEQAAKVMGVSRQTVGRVLERGGARPSSSAAASTVWSRAACAASPARPAGQTPARGGRPPVRSAAPKTSASAGDLANAVIADAGAAEPAPAALATVPDEAAATVPVPAEARDAAVRAAGWAAAATEPTITNGETPP